MSTTIFNRREIDQWCLTCNRPENMVHNDWFYGHWMYCKCPRYWRENSSLGILPSTSKAMSLQPRRRTMDWLVSAEIVLQDADAKAKTEPVTGYISFEITADNFGQAKEQAEALLTAKMEDAEITGLGFKPVKED